MTINLRCLIVLLAVILVTTLSVPPVTADWFYNDAKSQLASNLLAENMSALK